MVLASSDSDDDTVDDIGALMDLMMDVDVDWVRGKVGLVAEG
jgi:hypothetical protein